jgi:amidase
MKRRNFFKTAAIAGGTLAIAPLSSCVQPTTSTDSTTDYSDFELNESTIAQLQKKMSSGALTSEEITKNTLAASSRSTGKGLNFAL